MPGGKSGWPAKLIVRAVMAQPLPAGGSGDQV
jgi:hypothetical protein